MMSASPLAVLVKPAFFLQVSPVSHSFRLLFPQLASMFCVFSSCPKYIRLLEPSSHKDCRSLHTDLRALFDNACAGSPGRRRFMRWSGRKWLNTWVGKKNYPVLKLQEQVSKHSKNSLHDLFLHSSPVQRCLRYRTCMEQTSYGVFDTRQG